MCNILYTLIYTEVIPVAAIFVLLQEYTAYININCNIIVIGTSLLRSIQPHSKLNMVSQNQDGGCKIENIR